MSSDSSKKVVKAGAGYVIGNYLLKGITFLSAPLFSRLLSTDEYGNFSTYLSYESIIYIFVGLALHSSINSAKYRYGEKIHEYISSIITLVSLGLIAWFTLGNIFFFGYKDILGFDRTVVNILIVHCFASSMLQIYNAYIGLQYGYRSFIRISSINAISNIVLSALLILTVFSDNRCMGRILGTVIPITAIGIYIVVFFFKKAKPSVNGAYWKFGLEYSLPIVPHGVSQVILGSFDRIMIKSMVGASEAGIYSFASTIYLLFKVAVTSLENVWKPWLYEKMDAKDYDSIRRQGSKFAFGMALFTSLILMVAPEIIKILGARAYWESADCVVPVLLGGYFAFLYTLPSMIEYFYGKTKFIAIGTMSAAALNVLLNYIFISRYGYIAAAYTTLVTYILYFIFHYILAKKVHGSVIYSTRQLTLISVGILLVGAVALALEDFWYVRWGLEVILGCYSLYWADKCFDIVSKIKEKLNK